MAQENSDPNAQKMANIGNLDQSGAPFTYKVTNIDHAAPKYHSFDPKENTASLTPKDFASIVAQYKKLNNKDQKLIILVRHGEGEHNYAKHKLYGPKSWVEDGYHLLEKYKDPPLTQVTNIKIPIIYKKLYIQVYYIQLT